MEFDRRPTRHRRPPHSRSASRIEPGDAKNVSHAARVQQIAHTPPDELRINARQPRRRVARAVDADTARKPRQTSRANHARDVHEKGAQGLRRPLWRRLRRLAGFLMLVGLVELGAAALTTPHFAVRAVDLAGAQITPQAEVQAIAERLVGQNWIRADLRAAEQAAQALPTVRTARVVRVLDEWPPRLTMSLEERQPFTRVGGGTTWWVVDREGVLFREATPADKGLSSVSASVVELETLRAGYKLPPKLWASVVELTDALQKDSETGAQWSLRRTYIDRWGFASLRLTGGAHDEMLVRLGAGHWPEKLQRTRQALAYFDATGKRASALNLVSFNMPTWTPRATADSNLKSPDAPNPDSQSVAPTTSDTPPVKPDSSPQTGSNAAQQPA